MEIKGTKEGILISLENQNWFEAKEDLIATIGLREEFFNGAQVVLDIGDNTLQAQDLSVLRDELAMHGVILSGLLSSSGETREAAQVLGMITELVQTKVKPELNMAPLDTSLDGEPAVMIHRTMRSGFKVTFKGHVVVLGDMNPGAEIIASGCVVVWGHCRGTVHAGAEGDDTAVVCALDLSPMQLRIASKIATTPQENEKPLPEIARINNGQIIADPWIQ